MNTASNDPDVGRYGDAIIRRPYDETAYSQEITVTLGAKTDSKQWKPMAMPLGAFLAKLCRHVEGPKDGPSYVLADMVPGQRLKNSVKTLFAVGLDVDVGTPSAVIDAALDKLGCTAVRYTTHSHAKTKTEFKKDKIVKFSGDKPIDDEVVRSFLREVENWDNSIVETAYYDGTDHNERGIVVQVQHAPIPKHRIVVPFETAFEIANEAATQKDAMAKWAKVPAALAEMLGVPLDTSCTDPSRLFYFPRHAQNRPFEVSVWGGPLFDWRTLTLDNPLDKLAAEVGKSSGKSVTAEGKELGRWSMKRAHGFQIADLVQDHAPERVRGSASRGHDIECPFDEDHSNAGDTEDRACFVVNAGDGQSEFFTISCRHETCRDKTNLDMLGKMLRDGWFEREALDDERYSAIINANAPETETSSWVCMGKIEAAISELKADSPPEDIEKVVGLMARGNLGAVTADKFAADIKRQTNTAKGVIAEALKEAQGRLMKSAPAPDPVVRQYELPLPDGVTCFESGAIQPTYANCLLILEKAHADWLFAYDELSQTHMLRGKALPWEDRIGLELNDEAVRVIRHFLIEQWQVTFSKEDVREACLTLARYESFNPVVEYLDALTWDRVERVDTWLTAYLGVPDTEYTRAVGKLWLVAAVRRAKHPGCKFDNVIIFEGKQGAGKSSTFKVLGGEWFSDAPLGDVESKDAAMQLRGRWLMEIPELSTLNRVSNEAMKAFVSRCEDRYRAPYDTSPRTELRRLVFGGSANNANYLNDASGNRRYWPVKVGDKINLELLAEDREQIWAEAVELEAAGVAVSLPEDLWEIAGDEQAERVAEDPWVEELRTHLKDVKRRVTTKELLTEALGIEPAQQTQQMMKRLRGVMETLQEWTYKSFREGKVVARGYERSV